MPRDNFVVGDVTANETILPKREKERAKVCLQHSASTQALLATLAMGRWAWIDKR